MCGQCCTTTAFANRIIDTFDFRCPRRSRLAVNRTLDIEKRADPLHRRKPPLRTAAYWDHDGGIGSAKPMIAVQAAESG